MTRVLFTWEMGRNFGHASLMMPIARALAGRGVTVFMALQNPAAVADIIGETDIQTLAAPHVMPRAPRPTRQPVPVITFADDLAPCGYTNPNELAALIRCWHSLYDLVLPDVIVANSSPTAQIAARHSGIETINLGIGYAVPPLTDPLPAFQYWKPVDDVALRAREQPVLDCINAAMVALKLPKFRSFAEAMATDHEFLTTFPELDQYATRIDGDYVGPLFTNDAGDKPVWPKSDTKRPRVFGYIRPNHPLFLSVLKMLAKMNVDSLVVAPGAPKKLIDDFSRNNMRVQIAPVNMDQVLKECDVVVNHASHGVVAAAALAGKPQFMIPSQIEQLMMARRIAELNTGTMCHPNASAAQLDAAFSALIDEDSFQIRATEFANRHTGYTPTAAAKKIADRIMAMAEPELKTKPPSKQRAKK